MLIGINGIPTKSKKYKTNSANLLWSSEMTIFQADKNGRHPLLQDKIPIQYDWYL